MLNQVLLFLLETFLGLFALALLLRFHMQWLRAPVRNPISQFLNALTDWAVVPLALNVAQVVEITGLARETVYGLIRSGELPSKKIGPVAPRSRWCRTTSGGAHFARVRTSSGNPSCCAASPSP